MTGVLGLTFKTGELRDWVAADIARQIELYKRLRHTITDGNAMLLTRQAAVDNPQGWDAVQQADAAGHTVIFAFQIDPGVAHTVLRPRGLNPDATYDVQSVDVGPIGSASGADLTGDGIDIVMSPTSAAHLLILTERQP